MRGNEGFTALARRAVLDRAQSSSMAWNIGGWWACPSDLSYDSNRRADAMSAWYATNSPPAQLPLFP